VLTSDTQTPEVTNTTVGSDLFQSLQVISQLRLQVVGQDVVVLTVNNVFLSVQEPSWDLVLGWVLQDGNDTLKLFLGQLTSTLGEIDISLLTDQVGVTTTDTTDGGQSVLNFDLTVNVSVEQTREMLVNSFWKFSV
jgi:hypothetical protein